MPSARRTNLDHFRSWVFPVTVAGTAEKLGVKIIASTIAFNSKGSNVKDPSGSTISYDNITDSAKNFYTQGFKPGDQITVAGAVNGANNVSFVVYDISADGGTLILTSSGVVTTAAAGPSITIVAPVTVPEGLPVTIKAQKANTGKIYIGFNALNTQNHKCFTLASNESVFLQVRRTDILFLDADNAGEGVECNVEQNKQGTD